MVKVHSPLQAQLVQWLVAPGDTVREGDVLVILESMKMEHEVRSPAAGVVRERLFREGETVGEKEMLLSLQRLDAAAPASPGELPA
jgi:biotin carboxyl carrier protein